MHTKGYVTLSSKQTSTPISCSIIMVHKRKLLSHLKKELLHLPSSYRYISLQNQARRQKGPRQPLGVGVFFLLLFFVLTSIFFYTHYIFFFFCLLSELYIRIALSVILTFFFVWVPRPKSYGILL